MLSNNMRSTSSTINTFFELRFILALVYSFCFANGLLCLLAGVDLTDFFFHLPGLCIFKKLTGLSCPGCGMGHAFVAIGKFKIMHAISQNIFSVFVFFGGLIWLFCGNRIKYRPHNIVLYSLLMLVVGYGFIRNLL